ncbi:unnamed protein product [Prunus armeniaca]
MVILEVRFFKKPLSISLTPRDNPPDVFSSRFLPSSQTTVARPPLVIGPIQKGPASPPLHSPTFLPPAAVASHWREALNPAGIY